MELMQVSAAGKPEEISVEEDKEQREKQRDEKKQEDVDEDLESIETHDQFQVQGRLQNDDSHCHGMYINMCSIRLYMRCKPRRLAQDWAGQELGAGSRSVY